MSQVPEILKRDMELFFNDLDGKNSLRTFAIKKICVSFTSKKDNTNARDSPEYLKVYA